MGRSSCTKRRPATIKPIGAATDGASSSSSEIVARSVLMARLEQSDRLLDQARRELRKAETLLKLLKRVSR